METIKNYLKLVEIQTKVASFFPLIVGTIFSIAIGYEFKFNVFLYFFLSLISIDMVTTGLNHYFDAERAVLKKGYHYEVHNPITSGKIKPTNAKIFLVVLIIFAAISGLKLVQSTNLLVLFLGVLSFAVGILYSFGPFPISKTPFGEILSGIFMGGLIPLIAVIIQLPLSDILTVKTLFPILDITLNMAFLFKIFFMSIPFVFLISNIMLANNTCDREEDIINGRHTLPVFIGQKKALTLYQLSLLSAYIFTVIGVLLKFLHPTHLITLLSLIQVIPLTKEFTTNPDKGKTFVNAVKTFVIFSILDIIGLLVQIFIK